VVSVVVEVVVVVVLRSTITSQSLNCFCLFVLYGFILFFLSQYAQDDEETEGLNSGISEDSGWKQVGWQSYYYYYYYYYYYHLFYYYSLMLLVHSHSE